MTWRAAHPPYEVVQGTFSAMYIKSPPLISIWTYIAPVPATSITPNHPRSPPINHWNHVQKASGIISGNSLHPPPPPPLLLTCVPLSAFHSQFVLTPEQEMLDCGITTCMICHVPKPVSITFNFKLSLATLSCSCKWLSAPKSLLFKSI